MGSSFPIELLLGLIAAGGLVAGIAWGVKKARGVSAQGSTAEMEFERTMLEGSSRLTARAIATAPERSALAPVTPRMEIETGGRGQELGATARLICGRLEAGRLLQCVDGPLKSNGAELAGSVMTLKNGKRIAVLEDVPEWGDPDFEMLFRRFEMVVVPGAGEPIVLKRFQSLIGEMISL